MIRPPVELIIYTIRLRRWGFPYLVCMFVNINYVSSSCSVGEVDMERTNKDAEKKIRLFFNQSGKLPPMLKKSMLR